MAVSLVAKQNTRSSRIQLFLKQFHYWDHLNNNIYYQTWKTIKLITISINSTAKSDAVKFITKNSITAMRFSMTVAFMKDNVKLWRNNDWITDTCESCHVFLQFFKFETNVFFLSKDINIQHMTLKGVCSRCSTLFFTKSTACQRCLVLFFFSNRRVPNLTAVITNFRVYFS